MTLSLSTGGAPVTGTARDGAHVLGCDMCPHPVGDHDAISLRFCAATSEHALSRSCICRKP
jgi:hypothetical protein